MSNTADTEIKHTPGPWAHYDDSRDRKTNRHEIAAMGKTVCHIYHSVPEQDAANARLIAAAPDLLAVAQFFLRGIEGGHIKCAQYIDFDPDAETLDIKSPADRLREAIAKAMGND